MNRKGFTLVELLMVMIVLGLLASIAILRYIDMRNAARAASLTGDFRSVQVAVLNYYADKEAWPAETGPGVVPSGLSPYLPGGLAASFTRELYELDYEAITMPGEGDVIGVSVTTSDTKLMNKFIQTLSNKAPFFLWGGRLTYVISGPGGIF